MKEEEMNLENIKSKIKKFKWINRIIITTISILILISMYRISEYNDGHYLFGITIVILLPIALITISMIKNKKDKLELIVNKIKSDKVRMNNILNDGELIKKIKENLNEQDEEHKN